MRELWLRRVPVSELTPGDVFVKPDPLTVWGEDEEGWSSLRVDIGTRFEVLSSTPNRLTARRGDGAVLSQGYGSQTSVLRLTKRVAG